jgi:hypothetical protein
MFPDIITDINIPMPTATATGFCSFVNDLKEFVIARNVGIATTGEWVVNTEPE